MKFIYAILFASLLFSCSKDKRTVIGKDWQAISIRVHSDSALQYLDSARFKLKFGGLNLAGKRSYVFKIGSNTSYGKVKFRSKNSISFDNRLITLAGWDSKFPANTFDIFLNMKQHNATGESLTLMDNNGGLINFKKQ